MNGLLREMDKKIIILILVIIFLGLSVACATVILPKHDNHTNINNKTNMSNNTNVKVTHIGNESAKDSANSNSKANSKANSDPNYGSDAYVDKWDNSQKQGDSWAYTHNQPVKYEDGHQYNRRYNPDTGESYWDQVN